MTDNELGENIIDSHCHLDSFVNENRLDAVLKEAKKAGIVDLLSIGTGSEDWQLYLSLSKAHKNIHCTLGLHPSEISSKVSEDILLLRELINSNSLVRAIGEIGLDFHYLNENNREEEILKQKEVFEQQISIAKEFNLPIVVHSREAIKETLKIIEKSNFPWDKVLFHCFSESTEYAKLLSEKGAFISFSGILTYKNAHSVREAFLSTSLDKLMIETDAPYLAPVPFRGKENSPALLRHTAEFAANLRGLSCAKFCAQVTQNTRAFFKI